MMDLNAAADQIRQMAQRYEAMVLAADVLSKIGNLDNAVKEATARAKAANEAADKAQAEHGSLLEQIAKAKQAVEAEYAEQRAKQEQVVADLTAEGARLVQFAKDAAAQERAQVQAEADASAAQIYAGSFGKDPEFYAFYRAMQAYRTTFEDGTGTVVLGPNNEFLREFEPDFFFDDQTGHIESAARHVPAGHVASGVSNA